MESGQQAGSALVLESSSHYDLLALDTHRRLSHIPVLSCLTQHGVQARAQQAGSAVMIEIAKDGSQTKNKINN